MSYLEAKKLSSLDFKRLCGVRPETFEQMVEVVRSHTPPKKKEGRPNKLSLEDQVLMTLEYWREYRTYFHLGQSWRVNEATAYRIIRKIEDILSRSRAFTLPGKKQLQNTDNQIEVIVIDVTETPIERPKKNKKSFTVARKNNRRLNRKLSLTK
jgi:hypothetical protein